MNKKISVIFIILLASTLLVLPFVNATPTTHYSQANSNNNYSFNAEHPSATTNVSAFYTTWQNTVAGYANSISIQLARVAGSSGTFHISLYSTNTGTTEPDILIQNTAVYDIEDLTESPTFTTYTYNLAGPVYMENGVWYCIAVIIDTVSPGGGGGGIIISRQASAGYSGYYYSSQWQYSGSTSLGQIRATLSGDTTPITPTTPPVTPSPTPVDDYKWDENTDSWSWWNGTHWIPSSGPSPTANAQIVTFTGNMITYIVPLALLLLPAIVGAWALGKAGAAKWGFIAGLNIGAIMCYLYLPSFGLWAVIAIVMVDVVMIFASQRGD